MKIKAFNSRIFLGSIFIIYIVYKIFVTDFYNRFTGFNYGALLFILTIFIVAIIQFIKRKEPIENKKASIFWIVLFMIFTVSFLIYSSYNQKINIKRMYEIEKSKTSHLK